MGTVGFTSEDLANLKAAYASGALRVRIGDREVIYRSSKEILDAIRLVQQELNGVPSDTASTIQAKFSKGNS